MGLNSVKSSVNKEYFESGRWKCEKSPIGAHYWVIQSQQMTCKYCHNSKQVDATAPDRSKAWRK